MAEILDEVDFSQAQTVEASPQENASYKEFVENMLNVLYEDAVFDEAMRTAAAEENPARGLVAAILPTVVKVYASAKENGLTIDPDMFTQGILEVISTFLEAMQAAGMIQQISDDLIAEAVFGLTESFLEFAGAQGLISPEESAAFAQMVQQIDAENADAPQGLAAPQVPPQAPPQAQQPGGSYA